MNTADFETDAGRAAKVAEKRAKEIDAAFKKAGLAIGAALGTAVTGVVMAVKGMVQSAKDVENFSRIAGTNATEFQRWGAAADTVGISQQKLADQLKDFNEKVGEFAQTGGGGMKDFFDNIAPRIGITAEAFRGLSGAQGLQLYYDSLQRAGLSQKEMSFYLEAMASDTTALIPLLRDGGAELQRLGDAAQNAGMVMDRDALEAAKRYQKALDELGFIGKGLRNQLAGALLPAIKDVAEMMGEGAGKGAEFGGIFDFIRDESQAAVKDLEFFIGTVRDLIELVEAGFKPRGGPALKRWEYLHRWDNVEAKSTTKQRTGQFAEDYEKAALNFNPFPAGRASPADNSKGGSRGRAGKSDAQRQAEEAARAAEQAAEAQRRWHGTILDMEATLTGPLAEAEREHARNVEAITSAFLREEVTLDDLSRALGIYAEQRDREITALEARKTPAQQMLADLEFERELIGKTREEQELLTAARWLGAEAATAQGKAALAAMKENQEAAKAMGDQIALMDAWRDGATDALTDFVTGAKSAKEALGDFFDDMARMITRMVAERWMEQLFGKPGTTGAGTPGGDWLGNIFGALFGKGFSVGGYTGPGGVHQPAGIVHRGEVVWSHGDVARAGGVAAVEGMRRGGRSGFVQNVSIAVQGHVDRRTASQIAADVGKRSRMAMARNG